jgi:hypothetical protein
MAPVMFADILGNLQNSMWLIPESQSYILNPLTVTYRQEVSSSLIEILIFPNFHIPFFSFVFYKIGIDMADYYWLLPQRSPALNLC